jgi:hypothetical protein
MTNRSDASFPIGIVDRNDIWGVCMYKDRPPLYLDDKIERLIKDKVGSVPIGSILPLFPACIILYTSRASVPKPLDWVISN